VDVTDTDQPAQGFSVSTNDLGRPNCSTIAAIRVPQAIEETKYEVGDGSSTARLLISVDIDRQEADLRSKGHGEVKVLRNLVRGDLEGNPLSLLRALHD
jgi:hypothetical protein